MDERKQNDKGRTPYQNINLHKCIEMKTALIIFIIVVVLLAITIYNNYDKNAGQ